MGRRRDATPGFDFGDRDRARRDAEAAEQARRKRLRDLGLDPDEPKRAPLARTTDPGTSHAAGAVVAENLSELQRAVVEAFAREGPMSARRAERLADFSSYGFSTVRKRISELARAGVLVEDGLDTEGRTPATIYRLAEEAPK